MSPRAKARLSETREKLKSRRWGRPRKSRANVPARDDGQTIELGRRLSDSALVKLSEKSRLAHCHVIGTTGGGKSNFLSHCIRKDIERGRGVCVIDPHGGHKDSLYRSLLAWLHDTGLARRRNIHLIDPNEPAYTTGFNPLKRPGSDTELSVVADAVLEAFERVWQDEDTLSKPTIRRVLSATFAALAERNLTLAEAPLLFDPHDRHGVRSRLVEDLQDPYSRAVFEELHDMGRDERSKRMFREEVVGPVNRLAEFVRSPAIRRMIGQSDCVLDFAEVLDRGDIVLANLQGGRLVSKGDVRLLGALLVRSLFFHCDRRRETTPYFLYIDECHRFLSGDIPSLLDEARKYGLPAVLSHQRLGQLREAGENVHDAVRACTRAKVVFQIASAGDASELAEEVFSLNLEVPVSALTKPVQVGYDIIRLKSDSQSQHEAEAQSNAEGRAASLGEGKSSGMVTGSVASEGTGQVLSPNGVLLGGDLISHSESAQTAHIENTMRSSVSYRIETRSKTSGSTRQTGSSETHGSSESIAPRLAELPGAVHSKENMLHKAGELLRALPVGRAVIAVGMASHVVQVPLVEPVTITPSRFRALRRRTLAHSPAAQPTADADAHVAARQQTLLHFGADRLASSPADEDPFWEPLPEDS